MTNAGCVKTVDEYGLVFGIGIKSMKQNCKPAKAVVTKHAAMLGAGDESIIATVEIIEFAEKIVCIR